MDTPPPPRVFAVSTLGSGSNEEARILALLSALHPQPIPFDRKKKWQGFRRILRALRHERPSLVVMEGTGVAGGVALLLGRLLAGVPYVVSSGDAVGPWVARQVFWAGPLFHLYERILCRFAAGFIGWTPYLAGRALTFGTRRAITAPGYAPFPLSLEERARRRAAIRQKLGIPEQALVFGLVGSLVWARQVRYCYGLELVQALRQTRCPELRVLVVGDGTGRAELERVAGEQLGRQVVLPGAVPQERVMDYLAAMDVASLPQSCDGVGNFRFTTKISEYLAAGLPIVMGRNPMAYDLDCGYIWRLPGRSPWDPAYIDALARLMDTLHSEELAKKKAAVPPSLNEFDRERQVARVTAFISDLLAETATHSR